jgi:predicted dehydrogenase
VNFGVVGCGGISKAHLKAIQRIPNARAVACCDVNPGALDAAAQTYGIPRKYRSWQELLRDDAVNAVSVCLPHSLHCQAVLDAAAAGKHVLVEKPMACTLAECDCMIAACEAARVRLMVAQVLRRFPANVLARQWLREGRIGRVASVLRRRIGNSRRNMETYSWACKPEVAQGWMLYGYGAHEYDAVLWLLDTRASAVTAVGCHNRAGWGDYDEITGVMRLENGVVATVMQSLNSDEGAWDCILVGDQGTLVVRTQEVALNGQATPVPLGEDYFMEQVKEFVDCVIEGREPGPSGRNVRATMAALEGVKTALAEQRWVDVTSL